MANQMTLRHTAENKQRKQFLGSHDPRKTEARSVRGVKMPLTT